MGKPSCLGVSIFPLVSQPSLAQNAVSASQHPQRLNPSRPQRPNHIDENQHDTQPDEQERQRQRP
jgi:hypothetical protein